MATQTDEYYTDGMFVQPRQSLQNNESSSSSSIRLGKRALYHPPAVSEVALSSGLVNSTRTSSLAGDVREKQTAPTEEYPKGLKLAAITLSLCLAVFVVTLDQTIVATAAPQITNDFNSLDDIAWYGTAYLLTTAVFQLPFGKLYSLLSVKWTFLASLVLFELGSLVCAIAQSSAVLIAGRAIAGIGGAGLFSGALIIAAYTMPLHLRPIYAGVLGAISGIAAICGPLLGGVFTSKISWRWCFWINLPLGAITILVIIFLTPAMNPKRTASLTWKQKLAKFDFLGMACFSPSVVSCLLALQWGGRVYAWDSARIVALFMTSFVLFCCFVGVQFWRGENATLPPRIMKKRSIAGATWFSFALGACFFVVVYYLPLWFQTVKGATASESGVMNLPMILSVVIISLFTGGIVTAWGYYTPFMILSAVITALGSGLLTTLDPNSSNGQWIGFQIVLGVGLGMGTQQPLIAIQTVLSVADVATGTAAVVFAQTVGGALLLLIAQNLFQNQLVSNLRANVPDIDPTAVIGAGATGSMAGFPESAMVGILQSYNDALTTTLYVPTAMAAAAIIGAVVMEWKSVKGKKFDLIGA